MNLFPKTKMPFAKRAFLLLLFDCIFTFFKLYSMNFFLLFLTFPMTVVTTAQTKPIPKTIGAATTAKQMAYSKMLREKTITFNDNKKVEVAGTLLDTHKLLVNGIEKKQVRTYYYKNKDSMVVSFVTEVIATKKLDELRIYTFSIGDIDGETFGEVTAENSANIKGQYWGLYFPAKNGYEYRYDTYSIAESTPTKTSFSIFTIESYDKAMLEKLAADLKKELPKVVSGE